jgi:hypothetical protein
VDTKRLDSDDGWVDGVMWYVDSKLITVRIAATMWIVEVGLGA